MSRQVSDEDIILGDGPIVRRLAVPLFVRPLAVRPGTLVVNK